ncbi:hypothetical protein N7535_008862 [Penicillium sp. DV-2018c]|nr:hypothetical protein N7461_002618 [Penicillium sp. DV-2018c]KAJ5563698.1 hypothetical protein N7535_008862 [Penicillium sp. DV-2018c]
MSPRYTREEREGISKYLERMRNVFRPRSGSRRQSLPPQLTATVESPPPPTPAQAAPGEPSEATILAPAQAQGLVPSHPVNYTNCVFTQNDKMRALFTKYGLNLDPAVWSSPGDLQLTRVSKPIRMRVHRTCHRCETTFGADRLCINCQHTRCTKCPRYPDTRTTDGEPATRKSKAPEISVPQPRMLPRTPYFKLHGNINFPLTMPSYTNGQNLVYRPVRQRIHRYCHICDSSFVPDEKSCPACRHVRCKKCPRNPAKLHKYPDGYAGDADPPGARPERTFKKPRRRVHYICHICETWYQGASGVCAGCGQEKCADSIRIPSHKVKPEPDPEVIRTIEARLAGLAISQAHTTNSATAEAGFCT